MHSFHYRDGELYCEDVALSRAAQEFGTPLYVYSAGTILDHYRRLDSAEPHFDGFRPGQEASRGLQSNWASSLLRGGLKRYFLTNEYDQGMLEVWECQTRIR